MKLVNLGIVINNVDPKGIGRVRYSVLGRSTAPIQGGGGFEEWDNLDPFCASPFLPNNLNIKNKKIIMINSKKYLIIFIRHYLFH